MDLIGIITDQINPSQRGLAFLCGQLFVFKQISQFSALCARFASLVTVLRAFRNFRRCRITLASTTAADRSIRSYPVTETVFPSGLTATPGLLEWEMAAAQRLIRHPRQPGI